VALGESKLFVGATYDIDVYDLSNPAQPNRIGGITVPHEVKRLLYSGGLLYAALWEAGVAIYETTATGIAEHAKTGQLSHARLRAVPNPVNSRLRISGAAGAASVVVYDAVGRNVGTEAARSKGGAVELNMAGLRSGVYFVEVGKNPGTEVLRVIKP
jgi:hypothetical protein